MIKRYVLSAFADKDIDALFDFGKETFGVDQAIIYLLGLEKHFESLTKDPQIGKQRDEIKVGLLSFPYGSHTIFYWVLPDHIRIVRVLHGSRDLAKFLE